jgi:hypothetical protein
MRVGTARVLNILVVTLALIASTAPSSAQVPPNEQPMLRAYVLDLNKVNRFIAAVEALNQTKRTDTALAAEMKGAGNESVASIADYRAMLAKHPKVLAFYRKEGLTADDVPMISFAALLALAAQPNSQPFAGMVSPAQIDFVKQHPDVIARMQKAVEELAH